MPFVFDMSKGIDQIHEAEIHPKGWIDPVFIEYTIAQVNKYDTMVSVVWRVKGTEHCFTIPEHRLNQISNGKYDEHFKKALEAFRLDYLSWFRDEQYKDCEWKYEYQKQFGKFIKDNDN